MLVVGLAILATLPLPILPLQILYLNLVTDVFPAFALAMGEGESDVMKRPPRDPKVPILGRAQWITVVLHSLALTSGTFGALAVGALLASAGRQVACHRHLPHPGLCAALARLQHAPGGIGATVQRGHQQSVGLGGASDVHGAAGRASLSRAGGACAQFDEA